MTDYDWCADCCRPTHLCKCVWERECGFCGRGECVCPGQCPLCLRDDTPGHYCSPEFVDGDIPF